MLAFAHSMPDPAPLPSLTVRSLSWPVGISLPGQDVPLHRQGLGGMSRALLPIVIEQREQIMTGGEVTLSLDTVCPVFNVFLWVSSSFYMYTFVFIC